MKLMLLLLAALPFALLNLRAADSGKDGAFDLTTIYGETYHGCHIFKVTPAAVTVVYDDGVAKIGFDLLDETWKERYHYSPAKSRQYLREEAAQRKVAEARRRERQMRQEREDDKMMANLVALEKKQIDEEAKREKAMADAARTPLPLPPLAPLPGDAPPPPPAAGSAGPSPLGPPVNPFLISPLGPAYTPGIMGTPVYVMPDGSFYVNPDSGAAYVAPAYGYGGYTLIYPWNQRSVHSWNQGSWNRGSTGFSSGTHGLSSGSHGFSSGAHGGFGHVGR